MDDGPPRGLPAQARQQGSKRALQQRDAGQGSKGVGRKPAQAGQQPERQHEQQQRAALDGERLHGRQAQQSAPGSCNKSEGDAVSHEPRRRNVRTKP